METRLKIYTIPFIIIFLGLVNLYSQSFLTQRNTFQLVNWKFYKGEVHHPENPNTVPGHGWQDITVPHTWNAKDVLTEGSECYQGVGWYRTNFNISRNQKNERYFIRFEGVCLVTDVFFNGEYLGRHKGGYSAFCFEITPYIEEGENIIAVRVDNTVQPDVAPSGTDLYPLFGGIYRPVTIFRTAETCISPLDYASSGVYIQQKQVSKEQAEIEVATLLDYHSMPVFQTTSSELLPPKGKKGKGLYGDYFASPDFKGKPRHTQIDEQINFNWGKGEPFTDMPSDNFSIRWTGRFVPEKSGMYRFVAKSDDGSRLYLNNELVIDNWGQHAAIEEWFETRLETGKEVEIKVEYNEIGGDAYMKFGWVFLGDSKESIEIALKTSIIDRAGNFIAQAKKNVNLKNNQPTQISQKFHTENPRLWNAKADPYLYTLNIQLEDQQGNKLDEVEQPLGIRFFEINKEKGLILNGNPYNLHGITRHQEWEGIGSALTDKHHEKDIEIILEMGANGVRLAHYQQADKMYSLCDEKGLVVWAEIPNTPTYRANNPAYLQNCRDQLTELIKQNYNHPSILFWGIYNEIPIPAIDVKALHETAKQLDPGRLTTIADNVQISDRHFITDVVAFNWYFGWYYGEFGDYSKWYDNLHSKYQNLVAGLSEYGAGGCISQQQENPEKPDASNGRFFPEQYQRIYHEKVWSEIKDRNDIWCKFIWNMFDFSWTNVKRGDRDFINHKGLVTHDRKVKKDAFYFYKANWSDEPVLYILSRRNKERTESDGPVEVYTNLDEVELYVNGILIRQGELISKKKMDSDIHKISWDNVKISPGRNQISVIGYKGDKIFTDSCVWTFYN